VGRGVVLGAILILAAACSTSTRPELHERPTLGVSNGTELTVTLSVNGRPVATFVPGEPQPTIDANPLPDLPWTVEARSTSGRVLTSMRVEPGSVSSTTDPEGMTRESGTFGRVDLSCGRLTIWAGPVMPSGPAPASPPGQPGDCIP
jgi:hypothetical protein